MSIRDDIEAAYEANYSNNIKRVMSRTITEQDAEDIVQEGYYRALKYADTFNPTLQELNVWIDIIIHNAKRDYLRANRSGDYSFLDDQEEEDDGVDVVDLALDKDLLKQIYEDIAKLPLEQRQVVYATTVLGHSRKACRELFGLTDNQVKKLLEKFRVRIKEKYGE